MTLRHFALIACAAAACFAADSLLTTPAFADAVSTDAVIATAAAEEPAEETKAETPAVKLYMTDWCGFCRKTESLLDSLDVAYETIDIEKVPGARDEKNRLQPRCGVPVTVIAETSVCGFAEKKIRQLVEELKNEAAG